MTVKELIRSLERVSYAQVDGVAIDDIELKVPRDDRESVLAMAQKVATAVYEKSIYFNKKTA